MIRSVRILQAALAIALDLRGEFRGAGGARACAGLAHRAAGLTWWRATSPLRSESGSATPSWWQNAGGAGGLIGVSRVAKAAPDGYELVVGSLDTFAQSPSLRKEPPYDPIKDFAPSP